MSTSQFSRRGFLTLSGGMGLAAVLAGCTPVAATKSAGTLSGVSTALMPGTQPVGWAPVLEKVNAKLKKDLGFTFNGTFTNWTNYMSQNLLKFTAGDSFDTGLEALWANMAQLQQAGSLVDTSKLLSKYPNLMKTVPSTLVNANKWTGGHLWGIPQVNSAARLQHFSVRQDLADKYGFSSIDSYGELERFFYAVKQKGGGVIPYGANATSTYLHAVPLPCGMFNEASWEDPTQIYQTFSGSNLQFIFAKDAKKTGSSKPIPFWEDEGTVAALHTIRKYYQDGIINANGLNLDQATEQSQYAAGAYASAWTMTDGTTSNLMPALTKAIPGAMLADIVPLKGGLKGAKPHQTFQADNNVVINANGGNTERALELQDWLSIKENHDLVEYGIEGVDWKPLADNKYEQLSTYSFPGFSLLWRASLERRSSVMTKSEETVFDWAQDYDNFVADDFASFIADNTAVKQEVSQMSNAMTQFANPLFYGVVDVNSQLDKMKKAADAAGLDKLQAEMEKQADKYIKQHA
jgi:putative aldouronate transport system substrate-binding protein